MTTFAEILRTRADDTHPGLRFDEQTWTWAQVVQECADRAALLRTIESHTRGGEHQLHLGVLLENTPDYVFWIGAAALHGAAVVGINPTRRGEELAQDIRHTECDLIITEDCQLPLIQGLDHGVAADRVFNVDSEEYLTTLLPHRGAALPTELPDPAAILMLLFSSGSTGAPKAVICSQRRFAGLAVVLTARTELNRNSVSYLCMPLFHGNSAMMNYAPSVFVGATICLARKFSASGFVRDIHRFGATFVNYVGRALSYVLAQPANPADAGCSLQLAIGTEASAADIARFTERFRCRVSEGYGLSEGVLRLNRTPETPADSLGLPVGGADVRVLSEATGLECPPAQLNARGQLVNAEEAIGQIVGIRMAHLFEGYYKNPGAQADRIRGEDFWTGDLAYRDADGFFYFAGRSTDWIRVDSENFAAAPIERILERWPPVGVGLVYAVPDPRTGDQVMCTLQMQPEMPFDPDSFSQFLDGQPDLGSKWRPRYVRVAEEVPTTGSSKVAKTVLRRAAWFTDDPVYHRVGNESAYRLLTEPDRAALEQQFAEHGRTSLLPAFA